MVVKLKSAESPAAAIGSAICAPDWRRNSYPKASETGRSDMSLKSSPVALAATSNRASYAREVPSKLRPAIWSAVRLPLFGPPSRFTGTQPAMTVLASPGVLTQRGTPLIRMLGPTASATRELRSAPAVVKVPVVRP